MGIRAALRTLVTMQLLLRTIAARSLFPRRARRGGGNGGGGRGRAPRTATPAAAGRHAPEPAPRADAAEIARLKASFLAEVQHQIRTPLNGMLGMAEILLRTGVTREQRLIVERLLESGAGLLTATEDVLDLTTLVAGALDPRGADFDVRATVDDVVRLHRARSARNRTALSVTVAGDVPAWLRGDVGRLREVLAHLVANAVDHTFDGDVRIEVTRHDDDTYRFSVSDTGVGIPPAVQATLFSDLHHRGDASLGTGLAQCRRAVTAMGGDIAVSSVPGAGSVFSFTVALGTVRRDGVAAPAGAAASPRRPVVMIVDDDALTRDIAARQLEQAGCTVHTSANGADAVATLSDHMVDAVFMDCTMPVMDGFEATRQIRRTVAGGLRVPIIALTGLTLEQGLERCLRVGMNGYVAKPASRNDLVASLHEHGVGLAA